MGIRVGLDVGIASVGWCVLDPEAEKILGAGVRIFQAAEDPKTGASLALPRREARSTRRRLRRARLRMKAFRELITAAEMLSEEELRDAFVVRADDLNPYELRTEGLERGLEPREWVRVLSQMCKRRGYKSMRLSEIAGKAEDEDGLVKAAITANERLMAEKGYRTVGEMILKDPKFAESKRNKGDYKGVISREQLLSELSILFTAQRDFGNQWASEDIESRYLDILTWQAPIKEGEDLIALVGKCSIDRTNRRIPVACYTFERFRAHDKLNNVRYRLSDGSVAPLDLEQRSIMLERMFRLKSKQSYSDIRKALKLPDDARFVGVRYEGGNGKSLAAESKEKLPHPRTWHDMREAVSGISDAAWADLASNPELLDRIGVVLTYYKYDESITRELAALGLQPEVTAALAHLRYSKNGHLSRETLHRILPHMEAGLSYSDACVAAGLHHSARAPSTKLPKLPAIPADEIRNPVVIRALAQSRKVLNAIISEYGPIEALNIELARDLARSREDRNRTDRENKKRRDANTDTLEELRANFSMTRPTGFDLLKHRLWSEQGGRCAYSGEYIDAARLFSPEHGVAEVDHVLPHSLSFDDSYMNKVLVTTRENRNKGERTPYEYLGGDPQRWHEFEEHVASMHLPRPKRERLLRKDFDERTAEDLRERNLNDTRYIARFLKNFVEENLEFSGDAKVPVMTINGRATAYLRKAWRFRKTRDEGDLHHALDAIVIAAANRSMVQKISRFFSVRSLRTHEGTYYDPNTGVIIDAKHVPEPWDGFRKEADALLGARFSPDPLSDLQSPGLAPKPILVSRMPNRSIRGEAHKETIRRIEGLNEKGLVKTSKRVRLEDLTVSLLERMVGRSQDSGLYNALRERLLAHGGDGKKAFAEPFYKPSRPGKVAPRVRAIRVYDEPSSGGTEVRGGLADNGVMVRTDVFERDGRYYLVPVYLKDVAAGVLPTKAIVGSKAEDDWRLIDDSYRFAFSLHINDLVRLVKKTKDGTDTFFGYFKGTNRSVGAITIEAHDSSWEKSGLGVAQNIVTFERLELDVLGHAVHRVKRERRRGFSHRGDSE